MIRKRAAIVAAGITLSFFLAGCDGEADEPAVATAVTGVPAASASATAGGGTVAAYVEAQRKWVACMREQGFDLPDPDAKGRINLDRATNLKYKKDARSIAANKACAQFQEPVPAELEPKEEPLTPEQIGWRRDYAKCMRANGYPDWPDPDATGNWPQTWGDGHTSNPQEQEAQQRALQICDPVAKGRAKTTPDPNKTAQG